MIIRDNNKICVEKRNHITISTDRIIIHCKPLKTVNRIIKSKCYIMSVEFKDAKTEIINKISISDIFKMRRITCIKILNMQIHLLFDIYDPQGKKIK